MSYLQLNAICNCRHKISKQPTICAPCCVVNRKRTAAKTPAKAKKGAHVGQYSVGSILFAAPTKPAVRKRHTDCGWWKIQSHVTAVLAPA